MFRFQGICYIQLSAVLRLSVEARYRKLSPREHILKRPDMYVGTVHPVHGYWWLYDAENKKMEYMNVQYVPALQKIFDEIIVNAADNKIRQREKQTKVHVKVNPATGWISVLNNGEGIPVKMHNEYRMWVPQLIFGSLLTSSNYNDKEKRITGGCYGYGAKLTNIFSSVFMVETYDAFHNRKFVMKWSQNMLHCEEPEIIKEYSKQPLEKRQSMGYTKISFLPDYKRLNMQDGLTKDIQRILYRRVLDLSGILGESMKVYFNESLIHVNGFSQYAQLFPVEKAAITHQKENRWEMSIGISNDQKFHGISFVNSTFVANNGTHMKLVLDEIIKLVRDAVLAKDSSLRVRPEIIKSHLFVFMNCQIENPQFDSQQKQELKTPPESFGSQPKIKNFASRFIQETNIVDLVLNDLSTRITNRTQTSGSRQQMMCVPKLEDATLAGSKNSDECTLIITEGDSAKALAMSGLNVVGRERYGVFPVRGKPLNIRGLPIRQIAKCEEVMNILKILGIPLDHAAPLKLRYGKVMIMADQDIDGVHIKGLLCNIFQLLVPQMFKQSGFLSQFITPLVKVSGPKSFSKSFYSIKKCKAYLESLPRETAKQLRTKYYKGLGTSTSAEAHEYFSQIEQNTILFKYDPVKDEKCFDIPFGKENASERKKWITRSQINTLEEDFDFSVRSISYHDFVHKQLIQYSLSDCARTLPNFIDGLKTTQRKIIYGALRRDLGVSIKVQELSGYISEHCGYYHGDASLTGAIVRMAQDFVGSNNVPLLHPEGQFGTRMENGSDSAAPRYIFTKLGRLTKLIFREEDAENLDYVYSEGKRVEPKSYVPVVPMVLVNGSKGIATGFSTLIPPYNIRDLISLIKHKLDGKKYSNPLLPFYEGFKGKICRNNGGYQTIGTWELMSPICIRVKEIPTMYSIHDIKSHLNMLYEYGVVTLVEEHHTTHDIDFDIYCHPQIINVLVRTNSVHRFFKLVSPVAKPQMTCLQDCKIRVFHDAKELFDEYFTVRLRFYKLRKVSQLKNLRKQQLIQTNKHRFLQTLLNGKLVLPEDPKNAPALLATKNFDPHPQDENYAYLLDQKISMLTRANLETVKKKIDSICDAISKLNKLSENDLWIKDLASLEAEIGRGVKTVKGPERNVKEIPTGHLSHQALDYVRKTILSHANRELVK